MKLVWFWLSAGLLAGCSVGVDGSTEQQAGDENPALSCNSPDGPQPSERGGMGAIVFNGGTTFRVWAPNAERVFVAGDFNGWSDSANELASECNGNWSADVPNAKPGESYKFVIKRGQETLWRADPRALDVTNSVGESVIYDQDSYSWRNNAFSTPPFNEQVIYEMHVGTFNDSPGSTPGSLSSAIDKLDYLRDLGVNMIELMPITEYAGDYSWGYNPAFLFAPEGAYGSPDDLKRFIDEAHGRGIGVLIDVVHNHWGSQDLATWCFDGECYGAGGIYFYTDWRQQTDWGPRPDYGRYEVREFIRDNVRLWLEYYHADGLRWDSVSTMRLANGNDLPDAWSLLQDINNMVDGTQPWKIQIAEDLRDNSAITNSTASGSAGFDSQWDASFYHRVAGTVLAQNDQDRSMNSVKEAIQHNYNGQATQRIIYTESHDEVANGKSRIPEMIWPGNAGSYFSKKRSTLAAAVMLTSPGVPMIFQGQEFLEDGYFSDGDPLDWAKAGSFSGIHDMYRDLIRLRRNWNNNTRGLQGNSVNVHHVNDSSKVVGYHRWNHGGPGDDVVVVANFSDQSFSSYNLGFPSCGMWHVRFNSDWNGYSSDFSNTFSYDTEAVGTPRDGMGCSANVALGPYGVVVLSQ